MQPVSTHVVPPAPRSSDSADLAPATLPAPAGWSPAAPIEVPSQRSNGTIRGTIDALRGVTERGNGQPLSDAQVSTLGPFLANRYELPAATVDHDLRDVRIYTGGPAGSKPWYAETFGTDIYVAGKQEVDQLLSWRGRRWLAHELGHTMQWRRIDAGSEQSRMRRDIGNYVTGLAIDNEGPAGAVPKGVARWLRGRNAPPPRQSLEDAIHDEHWMEREAESGAQAFLKLHPTETAPTSS